MLQRLVVAYAGVGWLLAGPVARAEPITDRDYAIELYEGVAIGDSAQVGMGGAGAAVLVGSAGALLDPAAPAIRRTTDGDSWSWDYHFDLLTGRFSSDYDNNGASTAETGGASLVTAGLSLRVGDWAGALTATAQTAPVDGAALDARALRAKLVGARYLAGADLAIGLGFQVVSFELGPGGADEPLFSIDGIGALAGATWLPRGESVRASVAVESAIVGGNVVTAECDPMDCQGYILPERVASPSRAIVGGAYRWAPTAWNQQIASRFRDERALVVAADLVFAGRSPDGHGIEGFGMRELQPSGRRITASLRGGAEFECLPGRLRVRAGSYWEPGRFAGVGGRLHATFGVDVRVFELDVYGVRRGRISTITDLASRYRNIGLSIGFWH